MMKKRYRNGDIWDFEHEMAVAASREVVLGLDGGTTSTVCICMPLIPYTDLLPDPIPVLARSIAGCSNHNSVGETAARETLEQVMADALSRSGSNRFAVRAVCLAVSGVNHPTDQQRILSWLSNDAVAALASGTMGKLHGCVLIAGTGTIAYGFTEDGREARAAGAGPILGDWGSGYGVAAQALTAVVRAHDGRGPLTMLTRGILQSLELSSPDELIGKAHHQQQNAQGYYPNMLWTYADPSWARIAALVPVVVSCAEAGDQVANKILLDAVQELASSVKAIVQRLGLSGEDGKNSFPLVMVGGVLEANKRWDIGKEVINSIVNDFPGALPIRPRCGACNRGSFAGLEFFDEKISIGSSLQKMSISHSEGGFFLIVQLKGSILKLLLLQQEKLSSPVCEAVKGTTGTMIKAYLCVLDWQFCFLFSLNFSAIFLEILAR
ncbi:unnamed protein product [Camellia sinensis]